MTSKGIRHFTICLFAVTLLVSFISVSQFVSQQEIPLYAPHAIVEGSDFQFEKIGFKILDEETSTTEVDDYPAWQPVIGEDMYYPLALLFSILGISDTAAANNPTWLHVFITFSIEAQRSDSRRTLGGRYT